MPQPTNKDRLSDPESPFPHVRIRTALGHLEAHLPGTGLTVWEIAWLAGVYGGDVDALVCHLNGLPITRALIDEALAYASSHPDEIAPIIAEVDGMTVDRLTHLMPGIRPFPTGRVDTDDPVG